MTNFVSLDKFKYLNKISDDKGRDISFIFKKIFEEYECNNFENIETNKELFDKLIEESKQVSPTLIPYSEITNIIFYGYHPNGNESSFTEEWKSKFEKHIIDKFGTSNSEDTTAPSTTKELYNQDSLRQSRRLEIRKDYQNAILVIYKLIQHAELAIAQKQNLYGGLRDEVSNLEHNVWDATQKYDNMISTFISILGIFAAIMMASFGTIQGFTSILSNENNYSLTRIILISCFGLFALVSILCILLYSISKLTNRDLYNGYYGTGFFHKYPIYSHTLLFILIIFITALTHFLKLNPPNYMSSYFVRNLWNFTFLVGVMMIFIYFGYTLFSRNSGYQYLSRQMDNYLMKIKNRIGLAKLVNSIIFIIIGFLIFFIIMIIRNIN